MASQLDEAFNWLILILSTIAGALLQYPELYPAPPYPIPKGGTLLIDPRSLAHIRFLVFPIVILVLLWLWSLLDKKMERQIIVKSSSWVFAFIILIADIVLLLFSSISPYISPEASGPGALLPILLLIFFSPMYLSIIIFHRIIRLRMKDMYKDSKFLNSPLEQSALYILTSLFYFFYYFVFIGIG